jgi:hypothetical protein
MSLPSAAQRLLISLVAFSLFPLVAVPALAGGAETKKVKDKIKEVAGAAEFLRDVPKHFATLKAIDPGRRQVTLLIEGDVLAKVWPLAPDAEIKLLGWWGRLEHLVVGDRVWVWLRTDRKKQPVAVSMLADEISQQVVNGPGLTVESWDGKKLAIRPAKGDRRLLDGAGAVIRAPFGKGGEADGIRPGQKVYFQSAGKKARVILSPSAFAEERQKQQARLRDLWLKDGLPGTVAFVHAFSGEADLMLDHEAMRWGRSLQRGDKVTLQADPPIQAVVKQVQPWRERTQVRLVAYAFDLADIAAGQRLRLLRPAPPPEVDSALWPPDLDRPRSKQERIDWFLASIYCTCGISGNICTGHFYTLASCNPNGCGMPNTMRRILEKKIDAGLSDRQIFEELLREKGPDLVRPHLLP